jgi:molybdenum cofactor cytidylyltransferase
MNAAAPLTADGYCAILLAAGHARRFGADKLLQPLDGQPLACVSATRLQQVLPTVAVVRPAQHALIERFAALGVPCVISPTSEDGMGASIAAGIAARADAKGWLIALADMPFIQPATIAGVLAALRAGATIAAPHCQGRRGHPVGFAATCGDALRNLRGDAGARELLRQQAANITPVACDDPGIFADIDTPDDLAAAIVTVAQSATAAP